MTSTTRVAVLGAGPAGARAAELLARLGANVAIFDPKAPWEKPCGGGLTPAAFDEIPELVDLQSSSREIGLVRVELSREEGFIVELRRPMHIISRCVMGRWQLDRALAAGAEHVPSRVREIHRSGGEWLLHTDGGPVRASFLVGADGAASLVRRIVAPTYRLELAPTRVAYPQGPGSTPDTAVLRFFDGTAGYLWDFPRPDHRSLGIMVSPGSMRRGELDAEIESYGATSESPDAGESRRAGAVIGTAQLGHGDFYHLVGPDFALLGDAAGLADPLTGEGIQNALRSATLFARAWGAGDPWRYRDLARRAFATEFALTRYLRRSLLESGLGVGLVRRALTSDSAYAVVSALLNGLNEHEASAVELSRLWWRAWRRVRRNPANVGRRAWGPEDGSTSARRTSTATADRSGEEATAA